LQLPPIVYAEDNPVDVEFLKRAFAQARLPNELIVLPDGESAHTYFRDEVLPGKVPPPAVALVDLKLPRLNGIELIRWLREQPKLKRLPVVVLSGNYVFDDLENTYDAGANLYIIKPQNLNGWTDLVFKLQGYWATQNTIPDSPE
jgi:CheY-like chemotaxis protein